MFTIKIRNKLVTAINMQIAFWKNEKFVQTANENLSGIILANEQLESWKELLFSIENETELT